jgi:hypothetical protein
MSAEVAQAFVIAVALEQAAGCLGDEGGAVLTQQLENEIELWPGRLRAACLVDMDVVAVDSVAQ